MELMWAALYLFVLITSATVLYNQVVTITPNHHSPLPLKQDLSPEHEPPPEQDPSPEQDLSSEQKSLPPGNRVVKKSPYSYHSLPQDQDVPPRHERVNI